METWYVLEGGGYGDPREVRLGSDGKLHHNGRAVAYGSRGPRTRSVDQATIRAAGKTTPNDVRVAAGLSPLDHYGGGAGDEMKALREQYQAAVGKRPFPGWGADELRRRIAEAEADREMKPDAGSGFGYHTR